MHRFMQAAFALLCLLCLAPGAALGLSYNAATKAQVNISSDAALKMLYQNVPGSEGITSRAAGVLVFPNPSYIVGGQHNAGVLRIGSRNEGYYAARGLSYDERVAARNHSVVVAFMTPDALQRFENSNGWDIGDDASVALVPAGTGAMTPAPQTDKPVQVFVFNNQGLAKLALENTRIIRAG
jgi:lipid-binding SYLF domain-containing protein